MGDTLSRTSVFPISMSSRGRKCCKCLYTFTCRSVFSSVKYQTSNGTKVVPINLKSEQPLLISTKMYRSRSVQLNSTLGVVYKGVFRENNLVFGGTISFCFVLFCFTDS